MDLADRTPGAAMAAGAIALLETVALAIDSHNAIGHSLALGRTVPEAIFDYLRFFTILTNSGIAILMGLTAVRLLRRRPVSAPSVYRAATVYMIVTCLTYELLLRTEWSPEGLQFYTDLTFHDLAPALIVVFWLGWAPKRPLAWRGLPWILVYPTVYFVVTLILGAFGMAGYPYDFLNPNKLGDPALAGIAVVFLGLFLALGAALTAIAHVIAGRSEVA